MIISNRKLLKQAKFHAFTIDIQEFFVQTTFMEEVSMAKRLLIALILIWALSVVLRLVGGIGHILALGLITLLIAGIVAPQHGVHQAERRSDR